jgi:large subunit ribosomal protein L44e
MKIPKTVKRLCPYCRKHTEHKVSQAKKRTPGSAHPLSRFGKTRTGYGHGVGNMGKYGSKPAASKFKMGGKKTTKKTDIRYQCQVCKKTHSQSQGKRAKKIELV